MNPILVYQGPAGPSGAELPWAIDTTAMGIVTYKTRTPSEIVNYARCYDLLLILLHESALSEGAEALLGELRGSLNGKLPRTPIMVIVETEFTAERVEEFQGLGVDAVLPAASPCCLVAWQLATLLSLRELREFEQHRMSVKEMAEQTREKLHDLSQPLAAVQGRLQLLAVKCAEGDPNAKVYNDLASQAMAITRHVNELQHLHRMFS